MKKELIVSTALLAMSLTMPAIAANGNSITVPQMNGLVVSSSDNSRTGLWALPTNAGGQWKSLIEIDPEYASFYNGIEKDNIYYTTRCNAQYGSPITYVDAYDIESGEHLWTNYPYASCLPYDLAHNPYNDIIYGFFYNKKKTGMAFGTIEYNTAGETFTHIKDMEGYWVAIAAAPTGELYAISADIETVSATEVIVHSSTLHKIDPATGETTAIGETGQKPLLIGSATIDKRSGRMFWSVGPDADTSFLCEVDLTTGQATKVMDFEGTRQVAGLYVVTPPAEDDAPAAVLNASVSFDGGSLSGSVNFTAPETFYGGTPAVGSVAYTIIANGAELAKGTTTYGATVKEKVQLPERGKYTFSIFLTNDDGQSPKVTVEKFVGYGTPASPTGVKASDNNGKVTICWDPVSESTDGGYIAPLDIRYNVTRIPDNVIVESNLSTTSVETTIDGGTLMAYSYLVAAVNHDIVSEASESNKIVAGNIELPWTESFDSADALDFFTVIDANEDGKKWNFYTDRARIQYGTTTANDWLILPGINLVSGNSYRVSFKARCSRSSYPEKIEAKWGTAPTAQAMTNILLEPTVINNEEYRTFEGTIQPSVSGKYYIGIHGISDPDMYYLEVDDISVDSPISMSAPAKCTDLKITPDANGEYKALISFKAPATDMSGKTLSALDKIELYRGETLIHTFTAPKPGETLTFDDSTAQSGDCTYSVIAFADNNAGASASATAFIGTPLAAAVTSLGIMETADCEITLSWEKVTLSTDGKTINPDKVRYNIYDVTSYSPSLVCENVQGSSCTFTAVESGKQKFVQYAIAPVTDAGEGARTQSANIAAGTPYSNFVESFANGQASTIYATERVNYGNWSVMPDTYQDVKAQDNDGGYAAMNAYFAGYCGALVTGKISLDGLKAPALRFYSYTPDNEGLDLNTIAISVNTGDSEWTEIFKKTVIEMGETQGWHEVLIPLNAYAGKNISLRFLATTYDRPYTTTYIDNLSVISLDNIELETVGISGPANVRTGDQFEIEVSIVNNGALDAENVEVELWADDELLTSDSGVAIAGTSRYTHKFAITMHPLAEKAINYTAVINHPADQTTGNNKSEILTVTPVVSVLPAPTNLSANLSGNSVVLTWNEPTILPTTPMTDDFEAATDWAHNVQNWIFIDGDKAPVAAFGEVEVPGINAGSTAASFFVFSATDIFEGNKYLQPHSGKKYLAAFARFDNGTTDDWAISPELSGKSQTISFYAKSYHTSYPERIVVYYSTGSLETADFISAGVEVPSVPGEWTRYEATLPDGARYFAIRSCATGSFMLMLDDVTYQPASTGDLALTGYNVYRDREKVNTDAVTTTSFTDTTDEPGKHTWTVTAVYAQGESRGSNTATPDLSSISTEMAASISITAAHGEIIVDGAEGLNISVASTDGRLIFNNIGQAETHIEVASGIYIVKAGTTTAKLIVR